MFSRDALMHYFRVYPGGEYYSLGNTTLNGNSSTDNPFLYLGSNFYVTGSFFMPTGANMTNGYLRSIGSKMIFDSNSTVTFNGTVNSGLMVSYAGNEIYVMGTMQNLGATSTQSLGSGAVMHKLIVSGATVSNFKNTSFIFHNPGHTIIDRGTSFLTTDQASFGVNQYMHLGPGTEVFITNSTFGSVGSLNQRPNWRTILAFKNATNLGIMGVYGGINGGWPVSNMTVWNPNGVTCWENSAPDIFNTTRSGNGFYSAPIGYGGFEPWIIANRSNWYCNK
jgi:hypothetical protein